MFSHWRFRGMLPVFFLLAGCLLGWWGAGGAVATAGEGIGSPSLLTLTSSPLTVPALQGFDGAQQEHDQRVADRLDPQAVFARETSRMAYSHIAASSVMGLLARSFPEAIAHPSGIASALPSGAHIRGYASAHALAVSLPGHRLGIVESTLPIAERGHNGRFAPIDLRVTRSTTGFVPLNSDLALRIPERLSAGVGILSDGVSLTPLAGGGAPANGTGSIVHSSSVVYANTQVTTDTVVKPTASGLQIDAVLRSAISPQRLRYRVGAPAGSRLVPDRRSGTVRVVRGGMTIATITPPSAVDAAGTPVPATMSVVGRTVVVSVAHRAGSYLYPIDVDPEINDSQLAETSGKKRSHWKFESNNESKFLHKAVYEGSGKEHLETGGIAEYKASDFAYWWYTTQGNSKIYELKTKSTARNSSAKIESFLEFETVGSRENKKTLSTEFAEPEYTEKAVNICAWNASKVEECLPGAGKEKNTVRFQQSATASPGSKYNFSDTLNEGIVSISEPTGEHSTTHFNTTSPEVEGEVIVEGKKIVEKRTNALYGAGIWLTKSKGALQFIAKDPGIGVATTRLEYEKMAGTWENLSEHKYLENENACEGVQCYPEHAEYWTLDPKLPDGEDKIRYRAEEAIAGTVSPESESESTKTIKIDTKAPHNIRIGGLPYGEELSERPYTLTTEATDGEGETIASSGVKGIVLGSKGEVLAKGLALYVDGHEVAEVGKQTGCTVAKGQCTAKAEWTINGSELGAGHHAIVLTTSDNAGNEARIERTISVHHSTPVALGPGSVDLQSGDFALGATDVSLGSGLTVTRNHSSRATEAGDEGPLGPQWSLDLGTTESLFEMVDGSILLTDASGGQTIFAKREAGGFESPFGDANLKLTLEENSETKEHLAYYLEDVVKHTKTKFTLPNAQSKQWMPVRQEGTVAGDTVTYSFKAVKHEEEFATGSTEPKLWGITKGPEGNIWYTDKKNNKIGKMSPAGAVLGEYTTKAMPSNITTGPDGNLWSVIGERWIDKTTPSGSQTEFDRGVGTKIRGITAGPNGKVWFTEYSESSGHIVKMFSNGDELKWIVPKGVPGEIAPDASGNLWFTTTYPTKIDKWSSSGAISEYTVPTTNEFMGGIALGSDGNMWFAETSANKIGKITPSGAITEYSLPAGSGPSGVTAGPDGNIWFTDINNDKLGKITPSGSITEYSIGETAFNLTVGPDGKLWYPSFYSGKIGRSTTSAEISEPTEVLAPAPTGVSCSPELKTGCRALKFNYASGLSATGEAESQWGEYPGRLKNVKLDAYNPATAKMQETTVAEYSYDTIGRLRAEWDPRVTTALKTEYGYDAEGHVTALTSPGQESWAFTYGVTANDAGTGRLMKVVRAPASEALWGGEAVKNTETPTITGSPIAGGRMTVSDGKWTGSPISYGYQWEDCNSGGEACVAIAEARNSNYTLTAQDVGHRLVALVTATNGDGTIAAATSATTEVKGTEYSLPAESAPDGIAAGPDGDLWFTDSGTGRIGKITPSGSITEYPTLPAGSAPAGITAGPDGNLWFTDSGTSRIGKITTSGSSLEYPSLPEGSKPSWITAGPDGNLWFTDSGTSKIGKITTSGTVTEYALPTGSKPEGITAGPDGKLWFADAHSDKIGKITTSGSVTEYALPSGRKPEGITEGPDGNLWFVDGLTANKIGKITTSGSITEYALPSGSWAYAITAGPNENLWFTDTHSNKVGKITTSGSITEYALPAEGMPEGIVAGPDENLWFAELTGNRIGSISGNERAVRTPSAGWTMEYNVPLPGGSGLRTMTNGEVEKWGQKDVPVEGTAILPPDAEQGWPASSYSRATAYYLDEQGRTVNVSSPSNATYGSVATTEYNETNDVVRTLTADNRQTALEAGSKSVDVAKSLSTYLSYREECSKESENRHETESSAPGARLCDVEGPQHTIKYMAGSEQKEALGRLHTKYFYDEEAPGGETYNLQTTAVTLAELSNEAKEEVEGRVTKTSYSGQSNLGWKLRAPTSVTVDPEGKKLTTTTLYNSTTGQVTETRAPAGSGGGSPHDTKLIYYTAEANTEGYSACGSHPEWAGLLCESLPAKQPETSGVPNLPVITTTYNMYDEPLVVTETFGSTVRTKTKTYDEAGRLTTSETTSTANTALPKLTDEYNSKTGVLEKLSTTVEAKTQTLTSVYNTLGQLSEYTDADGNVTKYRYAGPENDGLLEEIADGSNSGTGKQTYSYNSTTKQLEELTDSAAGVFKASYDAEGRMVSETYPNAMCADTTYDGVGDAIKLEYIKTNVCSEHSAPVWFSETRSPSVRGETFSRSSTLASETYSYDTVGRLTETQETPAGEGCSVRLYAYDEESNRTRQTSRTPGAGGKCATEGGTVLEHTYDSGNRLTDTGIGYDSFGDIAKLPAGDAEGHELSTSYYVDGAVASQTQNGVTNSYYLDPEGRIRETVNGASAMISHYDGSGQAVVWTSEAGGKSTRNIPGIDGSLAATQTNGATPILQMHDLQGNITATAALSPSETKLLSSYNSTEFGVPNKTTPPKFAWLGAGDVASSLSSGVITYGATSYVPQIGRALQSEAVEAPGIAPHGTGAGAAYVSQAEPWVFQGAASEAAEAPGLEAAREREAQEAAMKVVDPERVTIENLKKSLARGRGYLELESIAQVLSFFDLPSDFAELLGKIAGEFVSQLGDALNWLNDAGEKLVKCAKNNRNLHLCKFEWEQNELELPLGEVLRWPNFSVEPRAYECEDYGPNPSGGRIDFCFYEVNIVKAL